MVHPVEKRKQHSETQMERKSKPCDCKGRRTCLLCEKLLDKTPRNFFEEFQVRTVLNVVASVGNERNVFSF